MTPWLLSIPLAYLFGSIPFGYLLVRHVSFDLRIARVRRLRRAGRYDEANAALDRLSRDFTLT